MSIDRRGFLFAATGSLFAPAALAQSDSINTDSLGAEWTVHEEVPGGRYWDGVWQRRGNSNIFDAGWRDSETGGVLGDVVEIQRFDGTSIEIYRHGIKGTYYGQVTDGQIRGTASWYPPGAFWSAQIR